MNFFSHFDLENTVQIVDLKILRNKKRKYEVLRKVKHDSGVTNMGHEHEKEDVFLKCR
jgi:hypothetical protein